MMWFHVSFPWCTCTENACSLFKKLVFQICLIHLKAMFFYKKLVWQAPNFGGKASGMNNKAIKQGSSRQLSRGKSLKKNDIPAPSFRGANETLTDGEFKPFRNGLAPELEGPGTFVFFVDPSNIVMNQFLKNITTVKPSSK